MNQYNLTMEQITAYRTWLSGEEKSAGTIEKYLRDICAFARWLKGAPVSKDRTSEWKTHLLAQGYAPVTINSMLAALNGLFHFLGWDECRSKFLRIQRRLFREERRELTRGEYDRLLETAKLRKYARKNKIASGEIFLTRSRSGLSRKQIWAEMKALCGQAGIAPTKVFPHNLRHLFARTFYKVCCDVVKLADLLGHSSVETTRIYLISSGADHARQLEQLGLVR